MKNRIISDNDPYVLDKITDEQNAIVALTRKNADFIEAVVALDSNYRAEADPTNSKSSAYWFNKMLAFPDKYRECLRNCIASIDRTNSTHLESTIDGRKKMFNIIVNYCPSAQRLKEAVLVNPINDNYDNLFFKLCESMENHKGAIANNVSFASKFISYARKYLNDNDASFSKYDKVVSQNLSMYEKMYVDGNTKVSKHKYENKPSDRKNLSNEDKQKYTYNKYLKYMKTIENILRILENEYDTIMNKEEFDHIVWYSSKG